MEKTLQYLRNSFFGNKPKIMIPPKEEIFNVENFNTWFCDPNNGANYANLGIFLRLDKLGETHITDYIQKKYDINWLNFSDSGIFYEEILEFYHVIRQDWLTKINNNATR